MLDSHYVVLFQPFAALTGQSLLCGEPSPSAGDALGDGSCVPLLVERNLAERRKAMNKKKLLFSFLLSLFIAILIAILGLPLQLTAVLDLIEIVLVYLIVYHHKEIFRD